MALSESEQRPVKIYSLGRFLIEIEGSPLRFAAKAQRKPLELLKALVALGGETVPVEQLTESLWPEAEGDKAQGSFATTLHRLRGLIGSAALRHGDARLTLDPGCGFIILPAKVVRHARYTCFQMAEVSIKRNLFAAILRRIRRLIQPVPV